MGDPWGYIPEGSTGPAPAMTSHETLCILNATEEDADVEITLYFGDRDPVGPYRITVPAERTDHVRFNDLDDPRRYPGERGSPASSSQTGRSSASTRASTPDRPKTGCSVRSRTPTTAETRIRVVSRVGGQMETVLFF